MYIIKKIKSYTQCGETTESESYLENYNKLTNMDYLEQFVYCDKFDDKTMFIKKCKNYMNIKQFKNRIALLDALRMTI